MEFMKVTAVVLGVLYNISLTVSANSLCYSCKGVAKQEDCDTIVECGTGEECYTKKISGYSGNVLYESGCMDNNVCRIANLTSHLHGVGKRADIGLVNCFQCCDGSGQSNTGCNRNLCGNQNGAPSNPRCYSCEDTLKPGDCHQVETCYGDHSCYTRQYLLSTTAETRYTMGCERNVICNIYANEQGSSGEFCASCCNTDYCNIALCGIAAINKPSFIELVNDLSAKVNQSILFTCRADPRSKATLTWTFSNTAGGPSTSLPNNVILGPDNESIFMKVSPTNFGVFTCTATNAGGSVTSSGTLSQAP